MTKVKLYIFRRRVNPIEKRMISIFIAVLCVAGASVGIAIWALVSQSVPPEPPEPTAPVAEEYVTPEKTKDAEKMDQPPGGGAVNITYSDQVTISLSQNQGELWMLNPSRSNQSLSLELVIGDQAVFRSGSILPGYQVKYLPLLEGIKLSPGKYSGQFNLTFYDAGTGKQALLNTTIPASVLVTE